MDIQKLIQIAKSEETLEKNDVGEFAHFKGKMMKITVESYTLGGGGTLALMESKGFGGLMKRDMLVVNALNKDVPMLVMQYMAVSGKRLLQIDFLDITKDKTGLSAFGEARRIVKDSALEEMEMAEEWYFSKRMSGSCNKKGKQAQLDALSEKVLAAYLGGLTKSRVTNATAGRALRVQAFLKDLFDHGCFGYDAIRVCLKQEKTEQLYRDWLFGAKGVEVLPDSNTESAVSEEMKQ